MQETNSAFKQQRPHLKFIRKISKLAASFLAFHMLILSSPVQSVWAAMIGTESIMHVNRYQSPRDYLNNLLVREEIQALLVSHGIDPQEAQARIDNLSDDEICEFINGIDQLPAGGSHLAVITMAVIFLFLVAIDLIYNNPSPEN